MAAQTRLPRSTARERQPVAHRPPAVPIEAGLDRRPRDLDLDRVGVVFVHGIGTQPACETFLGWSTPIVDALSDWRRDHGFGADPVVRCDYDLSGQRLSFLELDVPAWDGHPAGQWVMTEAWWAATTVSPGLGSMTRYVSHALPGIMAGIRDGYRFRTDAWHRQRVSARSFASETPEYEHASLVIRALPRRRDWIDLLDRVQKELTILAFGPGLILGRLALWLYAPFRAIPIKALQDFAALRSADSFLTRWFGELPDIVDDPIQAANVRNRLVRAIRGLRDQGCGRIVIVAHSGGAIVSFTTLCDPAYLDEKVDKLVTLGEGLALAWRIDDAARGLPVGSRLLGDLTALRPELRWADFWSTYDPAPAGPIEPPKGVQLTNRSQATINRMSILEDHGSYWDNDEEFVLPLIRHIDTPSDDPEASRFFRDTNLTTVRLAWRRQRVAVLALWRWVATLGAAIPLTVTTLTGLLGVPGRPGPGRLGAEVAGWWSGVPGHEVIAGPLDALSHTADWPGVLRYLGEWSLGSAIVVIAFLLLARIGVSRWAAWDRSERLAARRRVPERMGRVRPLLTFVGLTAVTVALAVATFGLLWR